MFPLAQQLIETVEDIFQISQNGRKIDVRKDL